MFTAIVLSKKPYPRVLPGVAIVNPVQTFRKPSDHAYAFLGALERVSTPWCFFLDDDDDLPPDYLSVLNECVQANLPVAYTNEIWRYSDKETLYRPGPYSQEQHLKRPMLVHHLAVMRTKDAKAAARTLPRGVYWPEMLLYWQLAKGGAHWVDRVGYIWNRTNEGSFSSRPGVLESQVRSVIWCEKDAAK